MASTRIMLSPTWTESGKTISEEERADLLDTVAKVASKELREDDNTRTQSLQQLKEWISKTCDIENCLTDDNFLLRFLRTKKFSVPMAEQQLLKWLNLRKNFPHVFHNLDCMEGPLMELINIGYIFASPVRDAHGRRVIVTVVDKFDTSKYTSADMAKVHFLTYETLVNDEENQILGFCHVGDLSGLGPSHVTIWSINEFATIVKWGEQSLPMRHKGVHLFNIPPAVQYVADFGRSRMSAKMQDRFHTHPNVESLHKLVDPKCLPKEYGGVMPMAEMIELFKKEVALKRDRLISYDTMNLLSDQNIIGRKDKPYQDSTGSLAGSFKKLEVD